jgi:glutathione S-transferase
LRINSFAKYGLLSAKLHTLFETVPKFKRWLEETIQHESVNYIYNEEAVVERTKERVQANKKK